ncbi:helix-turn-helix transcriptional regulator [Luteipulveratus mongoliensis]|uniref:DeoR faimly transcriptional regulator n=1 Tax=Luteipulveratus mongoliensis TaxID=571913 RepID=A0A0K1JFF3_9MICO|nr:WYL domain-containing protein [Luteipulveratus mongoliensis]AKU15452.1 hypothetical protein VV02_05520 [Luteipulveratus mongoliensis]
MTNPSARLLRLLTLLQSRPMWSGPELVDQLGISARTLRYDVAKLRELGYPVNAAPGTAGGYRLSAGTTLPPLQLDDDEAVATALALRTATGSSGDLGEAAATALVKLEQVLPRRLRPQIATLREFTDATGASPSVDADLLVAMTAACRDCRRVRFDYVKHSGETSRRDVEPYRVVRAGGRWYLLAFDPGAGDWRSFRLDRLTPVHPDGPRFVRREAPEPDQVVRGIDRVFDRHHATVLVSAPAEAVAARLPARVPIEVVSQRRCRVHATGPTPQALALNLLQLDHDFVVEDCTSQTSDALATLSRRLEGHSPRTSA